MSICHKCSETGVIKRLPIIGDILLSNSCQRCASNPQQFAGYRKRIASGSEWAQIVTRIGPINTDNTDMEQKTTESAEETRGF